MGNDRTIRSAVRELRAVAVALAEQLDDARPGDVTLALERIRGLADYGHALARHDDAAADSGLEFLRRWLGPDASAHALGLDVDGEHCLGCLGRIFPNGSEIHTAECRVGLDRLAADLFADRTRVIAAHPISGIIGSGLEQLVATRPDGRHIHTWPDRRPCPCGEPSPGWHPGDD